MCLRFLIAVEGLSFLLGCSGAYFLVFKVKARSSASSASLPEEQQDLEKCDAGEEEVAQLQPPKPAEENGPCTQRNGMTVSFYSVCFQTFQEAVIPLQVQHSWVMRMLLTPS